MSRINVKLVTYWVATVISYIYLVMPDHAAISIPVFVLLQFGMYMYLIKSEPEFTKDINLRGLWVFVPIFILALNPAISSAGMWNFTNFIVVIILFSVMLLMLLGNFNIFVEGSCALRNAMSHIAKPFKHFGLPFKLAADMGKGKTNVVLRVLLGLLISIPVVLILMYMLSKADSVFASYIANFFRWLSELISWSSWIRLVFGTFVGLYMFGLVVMLFIRVPQRQAKQTPKAVGDPVIFLVIMACALLVYSVFVFIQFRYLFAGAQLPSGLTYTEYARKGFFELCFLSAINISVILLYVWLFKHKEKGSVKTVSQTFNIYLCVINFVILASSFYRMTLYTNSDGLTRLRLFVFGFLIFQAIGLAITVFYVLKPKFNMIGVYAALGLAYYLVLNIVPIDYFVAKNQVDRYLLHGDDGGIGYITRNLSPDAAPQVQRIIESNGISEDVKQLCDVFYERTANTVDRQNSTGEWQSFNFVLGSFRE